MNGEIVHRDVERAAGVCNVRSLCVVYTTRVHTIGDKQTHIEQAFVSERKQCRKGNKTISDRKSLQCVCMYYSAKRLCQPNETTTTVQSGGGGVSKWWTTIVHNPQYYRIDSRYLYEYYVYKTAAIFLWLCCLLFLRFVSYLFFFFYYWLLLYA